MRKIAFWAAFGAATLPLCPLMAVPCTQTLTEAQFAQPLAESERSEVVTALAAMAESFYVDRDLGRRMAAELRAHQAQGRYRSVTDAAVLARMLRDEMRAIAPDQHLQVRARIIEASSAVAATPIDTFPAQWDPKLGIHVT